MLCQRAVHKESMHGRGLVSPLVSPPAHCLRHAAGFKCCPLTAAVLKERPPSEREHILLVGFWGSPLAACQAHTHPTMDHGQIPAAGLMVLQQWLVLVYAATGSQTHPQYWSCTGASSASLDGLITH